jgi:DNA-binding NarL/FixJ family response regulator
MQSQTLTCVIVDDEVINTDILTDYVSQISYLNLKMVFQNPIEALTYLLKNPTDLLITDVKMPQLSGVELYECISAEVHTQVIFVSGYVDKIYEALKCSATDYLMKPVEFTRFEQAMAKALIFAQFKMRKYGDIPVEILEEVSKNLNTLTPTENKVWDLICEGKTSKQIAESLFIEQGTVDTHRNKIRKKLNIDKQYKLDVIAFYLIEKIK